MKLRLAPLALVLAAILPLAAVAQTPPPRAHAAPRTTHTPDGFAARLELLLRDSRERRVRVVLRIHGEEVAGVVQDLGPGWVVLSNQEDQQILLQTHSVERAEIR